MTTKVPTRTCIACSKSLAKGDLVRVVRSPEGEVRLDANGKAPGRGAYICLDAACFEKVRAKRLLAGKLRTKLSAEDYENIQKDFDALCAASAEVR